MKAHRIRVPAVPVFAAAVLALALAACSDDALTVVPATIAPTIDDPAQPRVTLSGALTLDGEPLNADFLGARVIHDGLTTACQAEIPSVSGGRYQIPILSGDQHRGCGVQGAEIVLWTFVNERYLYSLETLGWPAEGAETTFDATFSPASPLGATKPVTGMKGLLFDRDGNSLPDGSVIEAYVGDTLCGVTQLLDNDATEGYYTLSVAGPDAIPGCDAGAPISFRIDGAPATGTAVNDLAGAAGGREVNLTLQ
jgi:hypothetical protein